MTDIKDENSSLDRQKHTELAENLLRTMRITTNARFEASKRLRLIGSLCFLSTTLASLGLILIPLLDLADHNSVFSTETITVVQIFLAVCVLVYSTAISTANYQIRSKEFLECGDKIKAVVNDFKLHLIDMESMDQQPELKKFTDLYSSALIGTENHEDIDYTKSMESYNLKENGKKEIKWSSVFLKIKSFFKIYMPFLVLMFLETFFISDMIGFSKILEKIHIPPNSSESS